MISYSKEGILAEGAGRFAVRPHVWQHLAVSRFSALGVGKGQRSLIVTHS